MSKGFASSYRIVLLAAGVIACFGALGVRLVFLHVIDREDLIGSIERARRQIIPETARRGDILDARGNILATSRSLIVLGVDPQVLRKEDEAKWPELAQLIDMPYGQLARIFTTKTRRADSGAENEDASKLTIFSPTPAPDPTPAANQKSDDTEFDEAVDENGERAIRWAKLSESVTESTYAKIQALGIKGVYGNRVYRRAYPHKTLAAHIVGYVNKEGSAAAGIEAYADFYLRGRDGWREGERD
ncbi:MAG TPA: penicillin-binding protein 2, partial [Opitutus sp.]|nr:penicillin-binding protein 2 [Opitutus sp.]